MLYGMCSQFFSPLPLFFHDLIQTVFTSRLLHVLAFVFHSYSYKQGSSFFLIDDFDMDNDDE